MSRFPLYLLVCLVCFRADTFAEGFKFSETESYLAEVNLRNNQNSSVYIEKSASAYNSLNNEYLVVWHEKDFSAGHVKTVQSIYGLRLTAGGLPMGEKFLISPEKATGDTSNGRDPHVSYDPAKNRYLVAWSMTDIVTYGQVMAQFIDGSSGTKLGAPLTIGSGYPANTTADFVRVSGTKTAYNSLSGEFIVVWEGGANFGGYGASVINIYARKVSSSGTLGSINRISYFSVDPGRHEKSLYPEVVYNSRENRYLIAWSLILDANTFITRLGQHIDGTTFAPLTTKNVNLYEKKSFNFSALFAQFSLAYNPVKNEYYTVSGGLSITGDRFSPSLTLINSRMINNLQSDSDNNAVANSIPSLAYRPTHHDYIVLWDAGKRKYGDPRARYLHGQLIKADSGELLGVFNFRATQYTSNYLSIMAPKPSVAIDSSGNILSSYFQVTKIGNNYYRDLFSKIFRPYLVDMNFDGKKPMASGLKAKIKKAKQTASFKIFTAACLNSSKAEGDISVKVYFSQNKLLEKGTDQLKKFKKLKKKKSLNFKVKKRRKMPKFLLIECLAGSAVEGSTAFAKIGKF